MNLTESWHCPAPCSGRRLRHVTTLILAGVGLTALIDPAWVGGAEPARQPNFVLCMADDLGWGDLAYNGNPDVKTPVLDEMAKTGIRFDRFYAAYNVCSP